MSTRRRKYLINHKFQLRHTLTYVGVTMVGLVVAAAFMLHDINRQVEAYIVSPDIQISTTGEIIFPVVFKVSAAFSVILLAVIIAMSIVYYRSTKSIAANISGNIRNMEEGRLDFKMGMGGTSDFRELEDAFNRMLTENSARVSALQDSASRMEDGLDSLAAAVSSGRTPGPELDNLRHDLSKIDRVLSEFRLQ